MSIYWCEQAWLPGGIAAGVRISVEDGRFTQVRAGAPRDGGTRLTGLVLPGLANAHSHAFHRALRGRTAGGAGFETWRAAMYALADRLDPDSYLELATAAYAEMALAGVTCVGEFHYLHHAPGGRRYAEPNAMAQALAEAARRAGIRLTLLDTCYLSGGIAQPLAGPQRRFGDGDAAGWAERIRLLPTDGAGFRAGAAVHSVRAVPADQLAAVAQAAAGRPLHVHLSEQATENHACLAAYGRTPTALLAEHGVLGPGSTAVHAVHLAADDVAVLGASGTAVCACPTTERDLADGIGPFRALADAGCPLALGSDQHTVVDMFEEARGLEMHERLGSGRRGRFGVGELVAALAPAGHAALGWPEAGRIELGAIGDLVAVRLDSVRTAGVPPEQVPLVATAADVHTVVAGGRPVVRDGEHVLGDVARLLATAVAAVTGPES